VPDTKGDAERAAQAAPGKKRGRPSKRGLKREALLEGAAAIFNARGIAATSLAEIAEQLGLSRASVYYYVNDRAELVFQCYQRACDLTAEDLAAAADAPDGLARTLRFVEHALSPERGPTAVLSEVNYLDPPHRQIIQVADQRNVAALTGFIEAGILDGSIRRCDAEVAAQTVMGIIAWGRLTPAWSLAPDAPGFRRRYLKTAREILTDGVAADPSGRFACAIDADAFLPGRFNAFDRREASEVKIDQLLTAASRLFNRDGIEATSMDAITESLGATKGVLYHYMRDKADLVMRCYDRAFDLFDRFAETSAARGRNGLEQSLFGAHINIQAQAGPLSPLMPQPGLDALPAERRDAFRARAMRLRQAFVRLLRKGMADGSVRPLDASIAALLGAGLFAWVPKWLPQDDPRSPRELADEICAIDFQGLRARQPGETPR
jgi:AcrR family transcriptional regulator